MVAQAGGNPKLACRVVGGALGRKVAGRSSGTVGKGTYQGAKYLKQGLISSAGPNPKGRYVRGGSR